MPHPLVLQLRFARSEFQRGLAGLTDADARRHFSPMNCISWNIGHLAWQEQAYWLWRGQDRLPMPQIDELFASGAPASTPPLADMWSAWHAITQEADPWLDTLTTDALVEPRPVALPNGKRFEVTYGTLIRRVTYHYWYHLGESMAVRQLLGQTELPQFVGNIDGEAAYLPESSA